MKKLLLFVFVFGSLVLLSSYRLAMHFNEDVLATLGVSKPDADKYILTSVTAGSGYLFKPANMAKLITMSGSDRATLTNSVCMYIKDYCHSDEFKAKYEAYRQSKKPRINEFTEEEKNIQRQMIAEQEAMYTPEMMQALPPEAEIPDKSRLNKSISFSSDSGRLTFNTV